MPHLISIIMPAYNAERYIAESIQSVIDQTYSDWELLVVDDGSTDSTAQIVGGLLAANPKIKYIFQQNGGQASARNTGLRKAKGELVAFLDSDDLWLPDKLAKQVAVLENMQADVVYSDGYIFGDDKAGSDKFTIVPGKTTGAQMFKLLFAFPSIPTLTVLAKKRVLEAVGFFQENRAYQNCEDYDLWLRLAKADAVFYGIAEKLVKYRRHPQSMTHTPRGLLEPMLKVLSRYRADPSLSQKEKESRMRQLYRELIAALVDEGKLAEAEKYLSEFSALDQSGVVTSLQKLLIKVWPRGFNFISRECLYRTEWHIRKSLGKL